MRLSDVAGQALLGRKGFADFDREAQEFEARKRQRALAEKMGGLQVQQLERELNQPKMPFEGTGFDTQIANEAYKFNIGKGMDDATARQKAIDMVLGSKTDYIQAKDPYTGQITLQPQPRGGIFNTQKQQAPAQQPLPIPDYVTPFVPTNVQGADPMQASKDAILQQQAEIGMNPNQREDIQQDFYSMQGLERPQIDPRAMQSPDVQKELATKEGLAQLEKARNRPQEINAAERAFISATDEYNNIDSLIGDLVKDVNPMTAGLGGSIFGVVPGSGAVDVASNLETIEADAAFSRLQQMRDASKTGGALGQVSERELSLLSAARSNLKKKQSPQQLRENLMRYRDLRNKAMKNVAEAFKQDYGYYPKGFEGLQQQSGGGDIKSLLDKYAPKG